MSNSILTPSGGYQKLKSYQKSVIIFDGTSCFVQRFLSKGDRTIDQMVQAARSGKQNIVEGSMASATSKETEIKLTGVARASLGELLEDYQDYLRVHALPQWNKNSEQALGIRKLAYTENENYELYRPYMEQSDACTCANIMLCLINQCMYLLRRQLDQLCALFPKTGGIRERMTGARIQYRNAHQ